MTIDEIVESNSTETILEKLQKEILKSFFDFDENRIEKRRNRDFTKSVTKSNLINKEIHMRNNYIMKELYVDVEDRKYLLNTVKIKSLKITYVNGRIEAYNDIYFEYHSEKEMQVCIDWYEPTVIAYLEEYGVKCTLNVCSLIELGCKVELIDYDI